MQHRAQVLWRSLMQGQEAGDLPDSFLRNVALVKEAFDEVDASNEVLAAEVTDIAQPEPTELEEAASETPNNNQKGDPL
jgi:hypothetical protein